jgi:hypothetical protein
VVLWAMSWGAARMLHAAPPAHGSHDWKEGEGHNRESLHSQGHLQEAELQLASSAVELHS